MYINLFFGSFGYMLTYPAILISLQILAELPAVTNISQEVSVHTLRKN